MKGLLTFDPDSRAGAPAHGEIVVQTGRYVTTGYPPATRTTWDLILEQIIRHIQWVELCRSTPLPNDEPEEPVSKVEPAVLDEPVRCENCGQVLPLYCDDCPACRT